MERRDFFKTAVALGVCSAAGCTAPAAGTFNINRISSSKGMKMTFQPYELELRHVFTVSSYSRKTTPGVQVRIDYEGYTGYGEASMPPYLGQSVETVTSFLKKVDLSQFNDPFQLETILAYVDSLSPGDAAAKAAIDIALHDLVGKLMGLPWWRIWGLDAAKAPSTTFTIGIEGNDTLGCRIRTSLTLSFRLTGACLRIKSDSTAENQQSSHTFLPPSSFIGQQ